VNVREVGIEEEFLLFDAAHPRLLDVGPAVVADAERAASDDGAQFENELKQAQAELATAPASDLDRLGAELSERRADLVHAARQRAARVVASGTSPVAGTTSTTDNERYRQMADRFAALQRRQLTCAMHVHVSIESDDEGVAVINRIAPWLAVVAALSANSPLHNGRDTGYASYRRLIWDEWPTAGPTSPFADVADYRRTVQELVTSGAARDKGMIYFDARLSANYPTVEIRVCDVCVDVADAITIAGLCRALVTTAAQEDSSPGVRVELLRAATWRAARWGVSGELVDLTRTPRRPALVPAWDLVHALTEHVGAALDGAGDTDRVRRGLERIRGRGTGADLQRAAAADAGVAGAVDATTLTSEA
jgi:carboxylate-amine ligase